MARKKKRKQGISAPASGQGSDSAGAPRPAAVKPSSKANLSVNIRRLAIGVIIFCGSMEILFWLLDYHVNYGRFTELGPIRRMSNLAREDGLGSWFGTTQTWMVGLTTGILYFLARSLKLPKWRQLGWLVLCLFFLYMAVDDGAEIHERMGTVFKTLNEDQTSRTGDLTLGARLLEFFPSYSWQIVFLPFFGAMGLFIAGFTWFELKTKFGRGLVIAAICSLVIGVSFDWVEGLDEDHPANLYTILAEKYEIEDFTRARFQKSGYDTLRHFSKTTEEALEMFAITLLWAAFIGHIPHLTRRVEIQFPEPPATG